MVMAERGGRSLYLLSVGGFGDEWSTSSVRVIGNTFAMRVESCCMLIDRCRSNFPVAWLGFFDFSVNSGGGGGFSSLIQTL